MSVFGSVYTCVHMLLCVYTFKSVFNTIEGAT